MGIEFKEAVDRLCEGPQDDPTTYTVVGLDKKTDREYTRTHKDRDAAYKDYAAKNKDSAYAAVEIKIDQEGQNA